MSSEVSEGWGDKKVQYFIVRGWRRSVLMAQAQDDGEMDWLIKKLRIEPTYDVRNLLQKEFQRLRGHIYLDHAGAALYGKSQIENISKELQTSLLGNPHSRNLPSESSSQAIEGIRMRILEHFNVSADDYDVIFTSGATEAVKIIADCFMWHETEASQNWDHTERNGVVDKKCNDTCALHHVDRSVRGAFVYMQENHTSILGIRGPAMHAGATVFALSTKELKQYLQECDDDINFICQQCQGVCTNPSDTADKGKHNYLFAYSAMCNYSGSKYPLEWIAAAHTGRLNGILKRDSVCANSGDQGSVVGCNKCCRWFVLLDAASYAATCPLDLSKISPDFVPISFYKMFGYPSGLGCLLVSRRAARVLTKTYFGGGTVQMVGTKEMVIIPKVALHERFEDGTLPFLDILALRHGMEYITKWTGGMSSIRIHVFNLATYTHHILKSLCHFNGAPVAEFYSEDEDNTWNVDTHGSIINLNLLDDQGNYIGFSHVERAASLYDISLRTGCVCNPGACQRFLNISGKTLEHHFKAGHRCGDAIDIVDGKPTGSVRVSFGYISTYEDCDRLVQMIKECFVKKPLVIDTSWFQQAKHNLLSTPSDAENSNEPYGKMVKNGFKNLSLSHLDSKIGAENNRQNLYVTDIILYPVKSCAGLRVKSWPMSRKGLLYDRHWMIMTSLGVTLTQKRVPALSLIKPQLDLENELLILNSEGHSSIIIALNTEAAIDSMNVNLCGGRVCGDRVRGLDCGNEVSEWFSEVLDYPDLKLVQQFEERQGRFGKKAGEAHCEMISLANESQYLIVHRPSVRKLLEHIEEDGCDEGLNEVELVQRFRPNIVLDGGHPYEEDEWTQLSSPHFTLKVEGKCQRCQMVCVNPHTSERTREPMMTLQATRGSSMYFGVHATCLDALNSNLKNMPWISEYVTFSLSRKDGS